jgi:hypothetical protein
MRAYRRQAAHRNTTPTTSREGSSALWQQCSPGSALNVSSVSSRASNPLRIYPSDECRSAAPTTLTCWSALAGQARYLSAIGLLSAQHASSILVLYRIVKESISILERAKQLSGYIANAISLRSGWGEAASGRSCRDVASSSGGAALRVARAS